MDDLFNALGRQAGLAGRYLASGVGGLGAAFANPLAFALNEALGAAGSDYRFPDQYEALQQAMTEVGLPEPEGALEKGIGFAAEVGVPDPTDLAKAVALIVPKAARMTRAEAEAAGLWHDVGLGKKLQRPVGDINRKVEDVGAMKPFREVSPEELQGGLIIPAHGDRSDAGKLLTGIDDVDFPEPVLLEGGHGFMRRSPDSIWASSDRSGKVGSLNNKLKGAVDEGRDGYMVYVPMGHTSMNHNVMMADTLLEQIRGGDLTKKAKRAFDSKVREVRPDWKGIDNPESLSQVETNGEVRKAFAQTVALDEFQKAGFPDPTIARIALTDPDLMDLPIGMGGQSIGRASGEVLTDPALPHRTYDTQIGGEYIGGFSEPIPREVLFPDWFRARRDAGSPIRSDHRSFDLSNPVQEANQSWLDGVMNYLAN